MQYSLKSLQNNSSISKLTATKSLFILLTTFLCGCRNNEDDYQKDKVIQPLLTTQMDNFELTPENAHPKAKTLLTEDFYWSSIEETGPFGSDDGSDAFYGFRQWRKLNKTQSPLVYLRELIIDWGYKNFDWNELNTSEIQNYILSNDVGSSMLIGQDNAIIAVGFGQFVLEGKIDEDIKNLTKTAIARELQPILIKEFSDDYWNTREVQLHKMLLVVDKMND